MSFEAWPEQADPTIKNTGESSVESETKKSFWEQSDNQTIASELNKTLGENKEWSLGYSDNNFFLKGEDYVNKTQQIAALDKKPYSDFGQMCGNLRGEELNNLVNTTFEDAKREDEKEYLKIQK